MPSDVEDVHSPSSTIGSLTHLKVSDTTLFYEQTLCLQAKVLILCVCVYSTGALSQRRAGQNLAPERAGGLQGSSSRKCGSYAESGDL